MAGGSVADPIAPGDGAPSPLLQGNSQGDHPAAARTALVHALGQRFAPPSPGAEPGPIPGPLEPEALMAAVRRHRLALVLAPSAALLPWPPETVIALRQEARRQQRDALALIVDTLEVFTALEHAGLKALLLKGPALAMQTTAQPWSRGGGDIDVLVAPADLPRAVAVLEAIGYRQPPGRFPRRLLSFWGRYSRWVSHELPLRRNGRWLDLHWAPSSVRAPLPPFAMLWEQRQSVRLHDRSLATLSLEHAFRHCCLHAAIDRWMELRQLVDLTQLAQQMPPESGARLARLSSVRRSCAAAYAATGCPDLLAFTDPLRRDCRRAIALACWAQQRPPRLSADGAWHPGHWWGTVIHFAGLSPSPLDWLRVLARFSLLPAAFNDPITGEDRGLVAMLRSRRRRLSQRLRERSR